MWLKNLIHKIFEFKPKAQEPISPQELTRKKAWRLDTTILVQGKKNKHQAVGDITGYVYRDGMTQEQAWEYAAELNQNKKNQEI